MILDLIFGISVAIIVGDFTGNDSNLLIIFGGLSAIAPDLDFLIYLFRRNWEVDEFIHEHRDLLHYPLILSVLGAIFFLLIFGHAWALVWFFATFLHFIHDTNEGGWGVRWLYPFDKRYFTLASYSPQIVIKDKQEQRQIAAKYGDPEWLKKEIKPKPRLVFEIMWLLVLVVFVIV